MREYHRYESTGLLPQHPISRGEIRAGRNRGGKIWGGMIFMKKKTLWIYQRVWKDRFMICMSILEKNTIRNSKIVKNVKKETNHKCSVETECESIRSMWKHTKYVKAQSRKNYLQRIQNLIRIFLEFIMVKYGIIKQIINLTFWKIIRIF